MGSEFTFYDYVNESGVNIIHEWLETIPKGVKAKLNKWLLHLEATKPGDWRRPLVDTLSDECAGLFEIRVKLSRQQYRILGSHGPGHNTPTLLFGFIKKDAVVPKSACIEALTRKAIVEANSEKHRMEHNYE